MHPNNSQHALNCCCYFRSLRTSLHCLATLRWPLLAWPLACTSLHEPLYGVMIVVVAFKSGWTILIIILNLNVPVYIDCSSQIMSRVLQILPELLLYTRISGVLVDGNDNESSQPANFHEEAVWTCGIAVDENLQTFWIRAWSEGCCYPAKAWRPQKYNTWEQPFQKSGWRNHFGEGYQKLLRKDTGILRCAKHIDIIHNLDLLYWYDPYFQHMRLQQSSLNNGNNQQSTWFWSEGHGNHPDWPEANG